MKTISKKITALLLMLVMAVTVFSVSTIDSQAASTKKVTANYNPKKAKALKVGNNKVTSPKTYKKDGIGSRYTYVKFVAPKDGTYKLTMSNIACNDSSSALCNFYICDKPPYYSSIYVKTNYGKATCLFMATKASYNAFHKNEKNTTNKYLAKRYGQLKLVKGQTVYIKLYCTNVTKLTYNVNVKKVK